MKAWEKLKQKIRDASFSHKLFAAFFITSSITLIPLGVYAYQQARSNLLEQEQQSMKEQIWQANVMLNSQLAQSQTVISSLLYNYELIRCLNTEDISYFQQYLMFENIMEPAIESVISSHSNILRVRIFTDNETLKGHSRYMYPLEDLQGYEQLSGRVRLRYRIEDDILTALCQYPPVEKELTNILCIEFRISDSLKLMQNGQNRLLLIDSAGDSIFASPGVQETIDYEKMRTGQRIYLEKEPFILYINDIAETEWKSVCFVPEEALDIDMSSILEATFLILILAGVLCVLISGLLCRWLLEPLESLQNSIRQVEDGNFTIEVSSHAGDEIGQLTNAFGNMVHKLDKLVNEVYKSQLIQKDAEFKMLQAQLNPHFLYNTLSFINWTAIRAGEKEIAKISRDISAFYRTALNSGKASTTVGEELLNAQSYINIQLALHNNSFEVEYGVTEECRDCVIICNVLQPLIENALEHGIDKKRQGRGKLRILADRAGDEIILAVEDNGPGFAEGKGRQLITKESKGYGLKNVNDRVRIFYGEEYGVAVGNAQEGNTRIEIRIPFLRKEGKENTGDNSVNTL